MSRLVRRESNGGIAVPVVTIEQLGEIVRDVFDDEVAEITEETTARDVEGWDSLNHIRFMVTVEQRFNVRFTSREVESLHNVGDLLKALNSKSPS
ncbi:acyl carrier protein [Novosphingobium sp. Gsoil 351]|uniref:acyl carrier protein n=1 Tax=Novosphingobium sp. Gsoil 351 TaxID=2675225 RepID=UPI00351B95F5